MATTKKGKKTPQAKKGAKPKKNNKKKNIGFFPKIMLILLLLSVITTAVFMIISNFKSNTTNIKDKSEIVVKKEKEDSPEKRDIVKKTKSEETSSTSKEEAPKASSNKSEAVNETNKTDETIDIKKTFKEENKLSGCWLSNEQGASLTMDDYGYRIDFFGVDASKPITGNYSIENNLIIFTSDGSDCNGVDGSYRITFYKKNISLICKDDECSSRRNILEADWEWIEI